VLALAEVSGGVAVMDDRTACSVAEELGVAHTTTVALLCDLVRARHLGLDMASAIADSLLQTEYHLPFTEGGFKMFVLENDLLPYEG
jgi:predicted nucleic acid-binding protein